MSTLTLRPNASGDVTQLQQYPTSGANWDKVDEETPDADSTYVWDSVGSWERDLYHLQDTSQTGTINSVAIYVRCRRAGAAGSYARTVIKTGGTEYNGSSNSLSETYTDYSTTYTNNPQTGSAWTWAEVNALQAGVAVYGDPLKSGFGIARCTQLYVVVDYTDATPKSAQDSFSFGDPTPVVSVPIDASDTLTLADLTPELFGSFNVTDAFGLDEPASSLTISFTVSDALVLSDPTPSLFVSFDVFDALVLDDPIPSLFGSFDVSDTLVLNDPAPSLFGSFDVSDTLVLTDPAPLVSFDAFDTLVLDDPTPGYICFISSQDSLQAGDVISIFSRPLRPISLTLELEQKRPIRTPAVKVEVHDLVMGAKRLDWERLYQGNETDSLHALAFDGQGNMHRTRTHSVFLYRQKVSNPGAGSNFSNWVSIDRPYQGNHALCAMGAEVSIFYRHDYYTLFYHLRSTNYGETWQTHSLANFAVGALTCDQKPNGDIAIFGAYTGTTKYIMVRRRISGSWSDGTSSPFSFREVYGLSVKYDGDWNLMIAGKYGPDDNIRFGVYQAVYGDGYRQAAGTWGVLVELFSAPDGQGVTFRYPFLNKIDQTICTYVESYAGTPPSHQLYLSRLVTGTEFHDYLWRESDPFNFSAQYGLAISKHGDYAWMTHPSAVFRARIPEPAPSIDLSHDLILVRQRIYPFEGGLTIELDNSSGRYDRPGEDNLLPIRAGSEVRLSLGYETSQGKEYAPHQKYWLEGYEHRSSPNEKTLVLYCSDHWDILANWIARHQFRWNPQAEPTQANVYQLIRLILARSGFRAVAFHPSPIILSFYPDFTINTGTEGDDVIRRLLSFVTDGLVFSGFDAYVIDQRDQDPACYEFGIEHPILYGRYGANQAEVNRILVIGMMADGTPILVDAFNYPEINLVGERRFIEEDLNLDTVEKATWRAQALLRQFQSTVQRGELIVPPNCSQELFDVIRITDIRAPVSLTRCRIRGIELIYSPREAQYEQRFLLGSI